MNSCRSPADSAPRATGSSSACQRENRAISCRFHTGSAAGRQVAHVSSAAVGGHLLKPGRYSTRHVRARPAGVVARQPRSGQQVLSAVGREAIAGVRGCVLEPLHRSPGGIVRARSYACGRVITRRRGPGAAPGTPKGPQPEAPSCFPRRDVVRGITRGTGRDRYLRPTATALYAHRRTARQLVRMGGVSESHKPPRRVHGGYAPQRKAPATPTIPQKPKDSASSSRPAAGSNGSRP
jgi:hypothetical protein